MLKRISSWPIVQYLLGRTIGGYMLLVGWTTRWRKINLDQAKRVWAGKGPVIACVWHGRFFLTHAAWAIGRGGQPAKFLVSQSREGGTTQHATRAVGAGVIRGSSNKAGKDKGGSSALREMLRHLEAGGCIGLTPDGPKGPRMRASLGALQLAKLSGAPLLPLAWSTHWRVTMKSWDRLILPLPFGRGAIVYGQLVHVPRHADAATMEQCRAALEAEMNRIAAEADRAAGVEVIAPAELPEPAPSREAAAAS
jgi:lysophospholipid acyltransferase (LPLAT)-like uncharacterized protein